ncbi:hypothetical protein AB0C27_40380 [Nonomuraea sp. NPDC048882]|uniref:hypothetical protein n=1 Tax=Nonomuraea sp. NPDC048882 TaxID=3154347 RepID=UPI0033F355E3
MPKFLDRLANAADRLAGAGAKSRMPDELAAKYNRASSAVNQAIELSQVAVNLGATRVARKQAERQLVDAVGEAEAARLMKQSAKKIRDSF